jgi:Xaa-Pro aminopeptidase
VTVAEWRAYSEAFTGVTLTPTEGIVERLRLRKDEGEIAAIRRACAITDQALESLRREIRVGMAERTLALKLEVRMREAGAEGAAFPFIVASGARSALPHGAPTERRVEAGDLLTFDVGAVVDGYHSDMTRTYFVHHIEDRARAVYDVVLEALELGVGRVRPGTVAREVDEAVRTFIAGRGYGEAFVHSTGHGVGLEIHEGPLLASTGEVVLEEGMVVTVEPGVYLPGFGGVRIEETVVVRKRGPEILTRAERAPTVVGG